MDTWQFQSPLSRLQQRAFLLSEIRAFFQQRNVLEVQTPILSSAASSDQHIDVFETNALLPNDQSAYLRTSPEFFHKRLLASGSGDIFEIAPVFRRGEISRLHNPEFTLLEWYRLGFDMHSLMREVDTLFHHLANCFKLGLQPTQFISYQSLFQHYADMDPYAVSDDELNQCCWQNNYQGSELTRMAALDFIFAIIIQPKLEPFDGVMVYHFPIEQAALAQINPDHDKSCLRFELLHRGVELANGYQELQDDAMQRRRFQQDQHWRRQHNKPQLPIDEHLLSALNHGLPDCSGVAVGIERLHMCLVEANELKDVMGFGAKNS